MLFAGTLILGALLMMSNVNHMKKQNEREATSKEQTASQTKYTGRADIGGNWMLYNTKGEPVTHETFAGKYYLIYFGFTYCPDVCPVSLMKLAKAVDNVKASKEYAYFDIVPIFVSVDPDRDSHERIEEYTKIFHPDLVGLTHKKNDSPELKGMLKAFKIHVSKIFLTEEDEQEDIKSLEENAPAVLKKMQEMDEKEKVKKDKE